MKVTPVGTYAAPLVGHLVVWDTTANFNVDLCAANENPQGRITKVEGGVLTMEILTGGCVVRLPYSGIVARGDKVEANGVVNASNESEVRADNATGTGRVISIDVVAGYVDVLFG